MSNPAAEMNAPEEDSGLNRLDEAVDTLVARAQFLREELGEAERRIIELQELFQGFTSGDRAPEDMLDRLRTSERENKELHLRLERARNAVDRVLAKIRFLEEQS